MPKFDLVPIEAKAFVQLRRKENANIPVTRREAKLLLDVEQYLNNEVSTELFRRFGVGFRIHLTVAEKPK